MFTNNVYVTVNGLPLHGTDSYGSEWIVNKTDGFLDGAPSTLATTQKIWSHGVFTNQPFYSGRVVSLEGYVRGTTTENAILSWDALKQALSLDTQDVTIDWRGYKRLLRGKQSGQPLVEWFDRYTLKFSLEFTSNTPFLYSAGDALSGSTYLPSASGGMTFPYAFEGDGTAANLSTHWTGIPDASTSTLYQDGAVVATNLLVNPKPVSTGTITAISSVTISDTPDGMMLTYITGTDPYVDIRVPSLPSAQYVIGAELVALTNTTEFNFNGALFVYTQDANQNILGTYPENGDYHLGIHSQTITTEANAAYVTVRLYCANNTLSTATWRNAGVYTQSDWQAMQALGIDWFSGDGYPGSWVNDWGFPEVSTSGSITLNSYGTASSPVIITISGYVVNPRIEHRQTGAVLALDYTIPVGETVVLNSETREVLINGKIPSQQIVSSRQWFTARPGENTFMFFADDGNPDTATITVEMREAWL